MLTIYLIAAYILGAGYYARAYATRRTGRRSDWGYLGGWLLSPVTVPAALGASMLR